MTRVEHPSLSLPVTEPERLRAEEALKDAYCDGRLDEVDLDRRVGQVLAARTRRELNACFVGLPAPAPAPALRPVGRAAAQGTGVGALAHFSALLTWIVGPLIVFALGQPGSPARREAARAFNFQLVAAVLAIVTAVLGNLVLSDFVLGLVMTLGWLGWMVLTVVGGARALAGQPWVNPVMRVFRWQALDPGPR